MKYNAKRLMLLIGFTVIPFFKQSIVNAADATVNLLSTKQIIDGFGASSAWCGALSDNIINPLYGDLGYSILRLRIEEGIGDSWKSGNFSKWAPELSNAKKATAKGAIVFASPWNPPASMQENFTKAGDSDAKRLKYDKYTEYVDYLNAYVKYMKDNGVDLYAVSVQNEPDYAKEWNWWTPEEMLNFVKNYAGSINCKVMAPESFQYLKNMSDPIINDTTAFANIDILGFHLYGTPVNQFSYPLFQQKGSEKKAWMTEHYFDTDNLSDVMNLAKEIHDCMVTGNMNAYVYWWITWPNGLANSNGQIFKRAYVLGQFAKFIRPGYYRVDATPNPATNVYVSAYKGDKNVVIVAVNTGAGSVNQKIIVQNETISQISSWQTNANSNMTAGQSYQLNSGSFNVTLPSQSVTTFVGDIKSTSIIPHSKVSNKKGEWRNGYLIKAEISKRKIVITPLENNNQYDITLCKLDGKQMLNKKSIKGITEIPVRTRGTYLVTTNCKGDISQKIVSLF